MLEIRLVGGAGTAIGLGAGGGVDDAVLFAPVQGVVGQRTGHFVPAQKSRVGARVYLDDPFCLSGFVLADFSSLPLRKPLPARASLPPLLGEG